MKKVINGDDELVCFACVYWLASASILAIRRTGHISAKLKSLSMHFV
jgi:hypothetical protein